MKVKGIGINAHPEHTAGEIAKLEQDLTFFQSTGYDYVELPADAIDVLRCGRLAPSQLGEIKALLSELDLKYTVHAPGALDLRDVNNLETQKELFRACIEFTSEIGAEIFVYHYGQKARDPQLEDVHHRGMLAMADYAESCGVRICVENIEIDTVANTVDFVRRVERESVGMTLDLGHAYLASVRFGFDFLESVLLAKPYVQHIHVQDNFGRFEELRLAGYDQYKLIPYRRLLALGKGDLHLPPGWGRVPLDAALALLGDYEGVFMLEYHYQRYRPQAREILEAARGYVERHSSP
ncbi:sugar phosphate isomerase/epimerase [Candidatus Bipolaricaulota bacterium]|nr:sugar phosphate isomerase/epimerase [Candidatus Bipolaricaulota bacterium]